MANMSFNKVITINVLLILIWNSFIFFICRFLRLFFFNAEKYIYKERLFEKGGKFYSEKLKIKKWKDFLPQYNSKKGFSKKNFSSKNIVYIDRFILETCRAEWNHKMCLIIILLIISINTLKMGIAFTLIVLLTNLPFIIIQRYNRFRLLELKKHRLKKYDGIKVQIANSPTERSFG